MDNDIERNRAVLTLTMAMAQAVVQKMNPNHSSTTGQFTSGGGGKGGGGGGGGGGAPTKENLYGFKSMTEAEYDAREFRVDRYNTPGIEPFRAWVHEQGRGADAFQGGDTGSRADSLRDLERDYKAATGKDAVPKDPDEGATPSYSTNYSISDDTMA